MDEWTGELVVKADGGRMESRVGVLAGRQPYG